MNVIGKLLPVDGFKVKLKQTLIEDYSTSLVMFYQPLIGIEATVLYQLLLQQVQYAPKEIQTHHMLMNYLNLPLNVIYRARLKLEGIGLLRTYQLENESTNTFLYELYSPYSPEQFLNEMLLSELLMHHLGKTQYEKLLKHFSEDEQELAAGKDVTTKFNDVYSTLVPTEAVVNPNILLNKAHHAFDLDYDFTEIEHSLQQQMIPVKQVLTDRNRETFVQLKQLYNLEDYEMEKALLWSLTEENELDLNQFRAVCLDVFKGKENNVKVSLVEQKLTNKNDQAKEKTTGPAKAKEARIIEHFEQVSPREILEDLSRGKTASVQDLKMISEIMTKQNLPRGVMNVAVHYCLIQSNKKLPRALLETIASHWSRLNVNSVSEAMKIAKDGMNSNKAKPKRRYYNQSTKKEVIPKWFNEQKTKETHKPKEKTDDKSRDEMLELLKKMSDD